MLMDRYFERINELQETIRTTQREAILAAGKAVAEAAAKGHAVHLFDTGHIVDHELITRGGGLMLLKPLHYTFSVENPVRTRKTAHKNRSMEGLGEYIMRASNVLPGDVLIMGSVSGKTADVVDLALAAKAHGVKLIVLTSITYSTQVQSAHSTGKRLFEIGDIVIDNCAPLGDAMMEVEGLEPRIIPASGLAAAYIMWAVTAEAIERLMAKGIKPSIFKSYNNTDGWEYNAKQNIIYEEKGY